jgi:hypothetical protein
MSIKYPHYQRTPPPIVRFCGLKKLHYWVYDEDLKNFVCLYCGEVYYGPGRSSKNDDYEYIYRRD